MGMDIVQSYNYHSREASLLHINIKKRGKSSDTAQHLGTCLDTNNRLTNSISNDMLALCNIALGAQQTFPVFHFRHEAFISMLTISLLQGSCCTPTHCIIASPRQGEEEKGKQEGWIYIRKTEALPETLCIYLMKHYRVPWPLQLQDSLMKYFQFGTLAKIRVFRKERGGRRIGISRYRVNPGLT